MMFRMINGLAAILMAPVEGGENGGVGDGGKPAPAVHTERGSWTKSDLEKMIADSVGKAVVEAMKANEEEARKRNDTPTGKAFELRPGDILRAGAVPANGAKGLLMAKYLGWMFRGMCDPDKAFRLAKRAGADEVVLRALGESTYSNGGAFVPQNVTTDYIELLYNNSVFLTAGPTLVPVPNGNITMPKLMTGATATWSGESVNAAQSGQTTGGVRLDLKKLSVLTAASNELLRDSNPAVEAMIRDDLAMNSGVVIDSALIRGVGSAYSPMGMKSLVHSDNDFDANATANVANVTLDLTRALRILEDAKIRFVRPAWFISPTVKWGLMSARDSNGQLVWAAEMSTGKLYGIPFFVTQNIPSNLGGSSDESEIYLAEMVHLMVGQDAQGPQIAMADGAAYHDGSTVQSGFSRDESVIRLTQRIDLGARQGGKELVVINAVDWDSIAAA